MRSSRRILLASLATAGATLVAGCGATGSTQTTDEGDADAASTATTTAPEGAASEPASTTEGDGYEVEGGPNVVERVPADADHVVDATSASFEPAELAIQVGDTVAFDHVDGGAHSVTAKADAIPDDAVYWASGGFDSQDAAEAGYEDNEGVLSPGTTYVHTFETTGTHEYYCIPHSHLRMDGVVTVEP